MSRRLHWRLMGPFALFTLGVSALFGLFAMAFVYTVEDRLLERVLVEEAAHQRASRERTGAWAAPRTPGVVLHLDRASLPEDLARVLATEPLRREAPGDEGRHYHLLALETPGQAPWLVTEVSDQLIVRPVRDRLLRGLGLAGLSMVALALVLAWWLARRISAPLEQLAAEVAASSPARLPGSLAAAARDDEIGDLARRFESLLDRTRDFITREQAFTRDVSHELRTPLSVLRMAIERMLAGPPADPVLRRSLEAMRLATTQMHGTIDTLLLLAREPQDALAAGRVAEPVALLPLVEAWVLAQADFIDQRGLALELALARGDALALPAPVLQRVVAILLENAFTHGAPGGTVRVAMREGAFEVTNPVPPSADTEGATAGAGLGLGLDILARLLARHGARLDFRRDETQACARVWR